jgi:hypothetical protein
MLVSASTNSIVAITARKKHSERWRDGAASVVTAMVIDILHDRLLL